MRLTAGILCWPKTLYRSPMFTLQPDSPTPLVTQIVDGLRRLIADGSLRPGAKIPSIRQFAKTHQVSVFTVVEGYDRLVAQGYLVSRPHSGFFVRRRAPAEAAAGARAWPRAPASTPSGTCAASSRTATWA